MPGEPDLFIAYEVLECTCKANVHERSESAAVHVHYLMDKPLTLPSRFYFLADSLQSGEFEAGSFFPTPFL